MKSNSYSLDRFEGDYAIFLKRPDEVSQLLIHRMDLQVQLEEGDVVVINDSGGRYEVTKLEAETKDAHQRVNHLLQKLQQKNEKQ